MKRHVFIIAISFLLLGCMTTKYQAIVRVEPSKSDLEIFIDGKKVGITPEKGFAEVKSEKMSCFKNPLLEIRNNEYYAYLQMSYVGKPKLNKNIKSASVTHRLSDDVRIYEVTFLYNVSKPDKTVISTENSQLYQDKIFELERKKLEKEKENPPEKKPAWIKVYQANLRKFPTTNSKILDVLEKGDKVYIQEKKGKWFRIEYSKFAPQECLKRLKNLQSCYINGWIYYTLISETEIEPLSSSEKRKIYVNQHPEISQRFKDLIIEGKFTLGMTTEMVKASWGNPKEINRTVYTFGIHEQWIYGSYKYDNVIYLYFEDGILTSWQD